MVFYPKYWLRFRLRFLLMQFKYLFVINYLDNKKCISLKNQCLQLNVCSYVFKDSIVRSVFNANMFGFLGSKMLVIGANDPIIISTLDLGSDFLFACSNGAFLNLDWAAFNELYVLYNNNFWFINYYLVTYYINIVLIIYFQIFIICELLGKFYGFSDVYI